MKPTFLTALLLAAGLILIPPALADDYKSPMQMHEEKMMNKSLTEIFFHKLYFILEHANEIGLTDDQEQRIKTVKMNLKRTLIPKKADLKLAQLDLMAEFDKDALDVNAAGAIVDRIHSLKAQKDKVTVAAAADVKKIVTPEQYKKIKDLMMKKMMGKSGCGMGMKCPMCAGGGHMMHGGKDKK